MFSSERSQRLRTAEPTTGNVSRASRPAILYQNPRVDTRTFRDMVGYILIMPAPFPHDLTRRNFLNRLGAGFGVVALEAMLRAEARAAQAGRAPVIDPLNPF